jgi:hypothetical protein
VANCFRSAGVPLPRRRARCPRYARNCHYILQFSVKPVKCTRSSYTATGDRGQTKGGPDPMMLPGMSAEASLYRSNLAYLHAATRAGDSQGNLSLAADSCQCTSPKCTWQCPTPTPPDPCHSRCQGLQGCARFQCYCSCDLGIWTWVGNVPSACNGYVCT